MLYYLVSAVFVVVCLVLILPFYMLRRRRDRERLAALRRADELAPPPEGEQILAELLGEAPPREPPGAPGWAAAPSPDGPGGGPARLP